MSYETSAMISTFSSGLWGARKKDKTVTEEVIIRHNAKKEAGAFTKALIDTDGLKDLRDIIRSAREYHKTVTLPWGENGERLLSTEAYIDYANKMDEYKQKFEYASADFIGILPKLLLEAPDVLGDLYNAEDYPTIDEIKEKFKFEITIAPVPTADDFRCKLREGEINEIKEAIDRKSNEKLNAAVKDIWDRIFESITRLTEQMSKEKPRLFESSLDKIKDIVDLMPKLNITKDPELDRIAAEMKAKLVDPYDIKSLRKNESIRKEAIQSANDILSQMAGNTMAQVA